MELKEIIEFSHKLYGEIEHSGMDTYEAIICADLLKNSLVFNNLALTLGKLQSKWKQN